MHADIAKFNYYNNEMRCANALLSFYCVARNSFRNERSIFEKILFDLKRFSEPAFEHLTNELDFEEKTYVVFIYQLNNH